MVSEMFELDLILKYPLFASSSISNKRIYSGVVTVLSRDFHLVLIEIDGKFQLESDLGPGIRQQVENVTGGNVIGVLDLIKTCLVKSRSVKDEMLTRNDLEIYKKVLREYKEFSSFHVNMKSKMFHDLSKISIETVDLSGRVHFLEIDVNFENLDDIFKATNVDLPPEIVKTLARKSSSLIGLFDEFCAQIQNLQTFFHVLDEIDKSCRILDPEKPTRKETYRRIYLGPNFSVLVMVDPLNPKSRPDLKFLGPEHLVDKHREILNRKLEDWNQNGHFIPNLLSVLGFTSFPVVPIHVSDSFDLGECSICFSLRLGEKLPEVVCPNKSCEKSYHVECLYGWLTSVNSKRLFNQLHGQCPNCDRPISCPFPDDSK